MINDVLIRCFCNDDADQVTDLWKSVFPSTEPWHEVRGMLCRKVNEGDDLLFVAESHRLIVGTVVAGYDGVRGWIYHLAVDPNERRNGIGSALLDHAEQALSDRGCVKINLQVLPDNPSVHEFYRQAGYRLESRTDFGKPIDASDKHPTDTDAFDSITVDEKIRLTAFRATDRNLLLQHLNENSAFRDNSMVMPYPYTEFDTDLWLARAPLKSARRDGMRNWAIRNEQDELIGGIGLLQIRPGQRAETGYWLAQPHQGSGIMTRCVKRLCQYAFEKYNLRRISAQVFRDNSRSVAVLTRSGFQLEGILRDHVCRDGQFLDLLQFGQLNPDATRLSPITLCDVSHTTFDFHADEAAMMQIDQQLHAYNVAQAGHDDFQPVRLIFRNADRQIIAGLKGLTGWDWLYVEILWVDEAVRGRGLGTDLIAAAERIAQDRDCIGSCLSTFSFQAPEFYRKRGYESFGRIDHYPANGTMYFMSKRFDSA